MNKKNILFLIIILLASAKIFAQGGSISGNFQMNMQTYSEDTIIGAEKTPEKMLMNSYANINYINGNFKAGVRYEGYFNPMQGYDAKTDGFGIPYRYLSYNTDGFDITVGNFYEQFGSGLIFRTYEDKNIGYDNAMEGLRVKANIYKGVYLKGIIGRQRYAFSKNEDGYSFVNNKGLIRGTDAEISVNEMFTKLESAKTKLTIGGGFISKYQKEQTQYVTINDTTTLKLKIPENVAATSGRIMLSHGRFSLTGEYAYKFNDPSADNNYIYKNGEGLIVNATYSQKGFGVYLSAKRIDNMSFRSDRTANLKDLNINYLPDISKNHTYALSAMYPYATQPNGEIGFQSEITYKIKKKSLLGGKYGTNLSLNFSQANSLNKKAIAEGIEIGQKGTLGYTSNYFEIGDEIYYRDLSLQIDKKINKKWKFSAVYQNQIFNFAVVRGEPDFEDVYTNIGVLDVTYKIKRKHSIRIELQELITKQDMGDWAMALVEYTISPNWFFALSDQYNYGNESQNMRIHYYNTAFGYKKNATRLQLGYGKQRAGVVCVGGVCRSVPAANGFSFSINSSF